MNAEVLVLRCIETMLLMPAVEYMTTGDITRAVSMIEASHPRPANGRVEGSAMWLTALCIRSAFNRCPGEHTVLDDIRTAARTAPGTREHVASCANRVDDVVQLGGSSLALALKGAQGTQIVFSDEDREACAKAFREDRRADG